MKNFFFKIYMLGFMVLVVFFMIIIWKVTFAHIVHEYHDRQQQKEIAKFKEEQTKKVEKSTFEKIILESEERVKYYLGYRILEQARIEGHFHHIGFDIGPDNRSYCIRCHGDMPHNKVKELRAFLNMHAFFASCETCHVRLDESVKTGVYKWYDRRSGEIVGSPVKGSSPRTFKAKIIPFEKKDGSVQRVDSQERIDFALEFRQKEETLTEAQKTRAKRWIHKIVSKQPYLCEDCHQEEKPLLPFESVGYSKERIDSLTSTEVVGMIKNYTKFYMPKMLHPGEEKEKE
jgi:hypothetical protein